MCIPSHVFLGCCPVMSHVMVVVVVVISLSGADKD